MFGLNNRDVKKEGAEATGRFVFTQIALMWVKDKNVNVPMFNMWIITAWSSWNSDRI